LGLRDIHLSRRYPSLTHFAGGMWLLRLVCSSRRPREGLPLRLMAQADSSDHSPASAREFQTTHWSVVLAARDTASPQAEAALAELCRTYWYPLYAFVRRKGHSPHDAQDLTQSFFARLLEKNYIAQADRERGRFRTYLLAALTHFLADEWDKARRLKRGGGREIISFDAASAEERYRLEPIDQLDAARLYERRWVTTLFDKVLARLERDFRDSGKDKLFDGLKSSLIAED